MTPLISAIINKALDGLTLRSEAVAQNIANANSRSYRPVHVSFEAQLAAAAQNGAAAVEALPLSIKNDAAGARGLRMDLELASQSETAMRYGALVDVLSREMSLERTIVRGGQ